MTPNKSLTPLLFYCTVPNDSESEETSCLKIPMKEVYSATDNFNASNFIGQGVAGENLCDLVLVLTNAIFNIYLGLKR